MAQDQAAEDIKLTTRTVTVYGIELDGEFIPLETLLEVNRPRGAALSVLGDAAAKALTAHGLAARGDWFFDGYHYGATSALPPLIVRLAEEVAATA